MKLRTAEKDKRGRLSRQKGFTLWEGTWEHKLVILDCDDGRGRGGSEDSELAEGLKGAQDERKVGKDVRARVVSRDEAQADLLHCVASAQL